MAGMGRAARVRARGVYLEGRRVLGDLFLERRWGTETGRASDLADHGLDAPERVRYEPSGWVDLRRVLRSRDVGRDDVFLDLGAGKGRIVLQAARYRFRRVIGVELSPALSEIAAANVTARKHTFRCVDVELVTADATRYRIPDDVTVIYLYNPFRGAIFTAAIDRVIESLDRAPRPLRIIYRTPLDESLLLGTGRFELVHTAHGLRPGREWSRKMSTRVYAAR